MRRSPKRAMPANRYGLGGTLGGATCADAAKGGTGGGAGGTNRSARELPMPGRCGSASGGADEADEARRSWARPAGSGCAPVGLLALLDPPGPDSMAAATPLPASAISDHLQDLRTTAEHAGRPRMYVEYRPC